MARDHVQLYQACADSRGQGGFQLERAKPAGYSTFALLQLSPGEPTLLYCRGGGDSIGVRVV